MAKSAFAARARILFKANLDDTQAQKTDEGCERNVLILTQKVGERIETGKKTFVMFCDLRKAFDTVDRELLWAKVRKMGGIWMEIIDFCLFRRRGTSAFVPVDCACDARMFPDDAGFFLALDVIFCR